MPSRSALRPSGASNLRPARIIVSTLEQRVAAIRWAHDVAGLASPTAAKAVRATRSGIRRSVGVAPKRKAAATVDRLAATVSHADPATVKGCGDRALLLFGFASAMRGSELVALDRADPERAAGDAAPQQGRTSSVYPVLIEA